MKIMKIWRRHQSKIIFAALTLISLVMSSEDIKRNFKLSQDLRGQIAAQSAITTQLNQQLAFEKEQAVIADQRYSSGCIPVVNGEYPNITYQSIAEGMQIFDRHTKTPLPSGTIVCDGQGNTGVVGLNGVESIAFTGNRDVVQKRLTRFRGGVYAQPITKGVEDDQN